ncbi:MAG: hypothetical protein ACFE89_13125 [Candidatus Hodarchaeota archaeon]
MVKQKMVKGQGLYVCEVCGLGYLDQKTAQDCEDWCRATGTCSVKITRKAVYFPNLFGPKP